MARGRLVVVFALVAATVAAGSSATSSEENHVGESCPTTVTASTTAGVSLMQAVSTRGRFNMDLPKEDAGVAMVQVPFNNLSEAVKEKRSLQQLYNKTGSLAKSLLQQGQSLGRSALDVLNLAPNRLGQTAVLRSPGALIFAFLLCLLVGGCAFMLVFHPNALPAQLREGTSDSSIPSQLLSRATSPTTAGRSYFPMMASPQLSMRGTARPTPEGSRKNLRSSSDVKRSPGQAMAKSLAGIMTSSDDEGRPKHTRSAPTKPSSFPAVQPQFCPDLVVPQHCECILVLPLDLGRSSSSFEITDVNGSPVLRAMPQPAAAGRLWRAAIGTAQGESLVQCCEVKQPGPPQTTEFHLLRAGGQFFAKLLHSPAQDRYLLTLQSGTVLHFWGNFENSAVNITDDGNRLLATTEIGSADFNPTGTYCRLRVAPLADVGLALCGLLCIGQHMTSQKNYGPP